MVSRCDQPTDRLTLLRTKLVNATRGLDTSLKPVARLVVSEWLCFITPPNEWSLGQGVSGVAFARREVTHLIVSRLHLPSPPKSPHPFLHRLISHLCARPLPETRPGIFCLFFTDGTPVCGRTRLPYRKGPIDVSTWNGHPSSLGGEPTVPAGSVARGWGRT